MTPTRFIKMHGLGNDFVIIDARANGQRLSAAQAHLIADRHRGIGCDQVITLYSSERADLFMRIQNADGSESGACGNAARCVAALLMAEHETAHIRIETTDDILACEQAAGGEVMVDLGVPKFDWRDIPLDRETDTRQFSLAQCTTLKDAGAVNVGNPHIVFFVADIDAIDLGKIGPKIEHDPFFPERVNVNIATIDDRSHLRLRVWERGAGLTKACGTGACATVVAAARRGLTERRAEVQLPGGVLAIEWGGDDHVRMTGPIATSYTGEVDISALAQQAGH